MNSTAGTILENRALSAEERAALSEFGAATLHEALDQTGAMASAIKPIYSGMSLWGTALTVRAKPGDNLAIHQAIAGARDGDVLVIDYDGSVEFGPFGDILATASQKRGIVGLVIDGCVRDGPTLLRMGFPTFARGLSIKATAKVHPGTIGESVVCGGVMVHPGDVVVGDDDGVVVIPRERLAETLRKSREREDREEEMRTELEKGTTTLRLLGLEEAPGRPH